MFLCASILKSRVKLITLCDFAEKIELYVNRFELILRMSTIITCPNCKTQFEPTEALEQSIKEKFRSEFNNKWQEEKKLLEDKVRLKEQDLSQKMQQLAADKEKQENEFRKMMEAEKKKIEGELTKEISAKVASDNERVMRMLEESNKSNEEKLKEANNKVIEFMQKMQEMKSKEDELKIELEQKLMTEREQIKTALTNQLETKNKMRDEEFELKMKEKDKQLDDQKRLIEEMRRRAEQGSMQLQGEVQELALEQMLRLAFPIDAVEEVGKGVKGADCIQTVRNSFGQDCGKIIFESKRTKDFSKDWIEKLKADQRVCGADIAVIVTHAMPDGMTTFGEKDGVWICTFAEARAVVYVLRDVVVKIYNATKSQENRGDKMTLLYNYLIGSEFSSQWHAIREGFMSMKMSIQRERDQMEKLWKAREKQLEKVLLNAAHIKGSIDGIAGMDVDLNLLGEDSTLLLE